MAKFILYTWTASHMKNQYRADCLLKMLNSLSEVANEYNIEIKPYVSIHMASDFDVSEGYVNLLTSFGATCYFHKDRMVQFEHLSYINEVNKFEGNDKIMFIDDDDMLISLPNEIFKNDVIRSVQSRFVENNIKSDRKDIIVNEYKNMSVLIDFSGYTSSYKHIKSYFEHRKERCTFVKREDCKSTLLIDDTTTIGYHLEDIKFTHYLDMLSFSEIQPETPFILRRMNPYEEQSYF